MTYGARGTDRVDHRQASTAATLENDQLTLIFLAPSELRTALAVSLQLDPCFQGYLHLSGFQLRALCPISELAAWPQRVLRMLVSCSALTDSLFLTMVTKIEASI